MSEQMTPLRRRMIDDMSLRNMSPPLSTVLAGRQFRYWGKSRHGWMRSKTTRMTPSGPRCGCQFALQQWLDQQTLGLDKLGPALVAGPN
jgi:hypothetical protein